MGNDARPPQAAGRLSQPGDPLCTAADVSAQPVRWLWKGHFALGKIAVVAGPANMGKSLLVAGDFASRISTGAPWPDGAGCPKGDVLIGSRHDGAADTLVPRLKDHGADLRRVHFVQPAVYDNDTDPLFFDLGVLGALHEGLKRLPGVKMAVIDPVGDFLEGRRPGRCADMLAALRGLARCSGAAFVLVAHLRPGRAKGSLAGIAPAALVSAARLVWVLRRDPDDDQRRLFLPAKNNLGAESMGHAWRLADGKVQCEAEPLTVGGESGAWERARRLAAAFIADFLKDGPRMWTSIERNGRLTGHRPATLERARGMVAEPFKTTGADGRWLWRLFGDDRDWSEGDIADLFAGGAVGNRTSGSAGGSIATAERNGPAAGLRRFPNDGKGESNDDDDDDDDEDDGEEGEN